MNDAAPALARTRIPSCATAVNSTSPACRKHPSASVINWSKAARCAVRKALSVW